MKRRSSDQFYQTGVGVGTSSQNCWLISQNQVTDPTGYHHWFYRKVEAKHFSRKYIVSFSLPNAINWPLTTNLYIIVGTKPKTGLCTVLFDTLNGTMRDVSSVVCPIEIDIGNTLVSTFHCGLNVMA